MRQGTCFLCGRTGMMELHHVFPSALRDKSTEYGFVVPLCGETCHRLGPKSAHGCRETADRLKAHFQAVYMYKYHASVAEWRAEWYKNYLDLDNIEDERIYPMNLSVKSGRLTADPELRHTKENVPVVSFRIAVRRPGPGDNTDFFNCVAWRGTAEFICKYFQKGKWIEVSGFEKNDNYEKDGTKYQRDVLVVERAFFGEGKSRDEDGGREPAYEGDSGTTFTEQPAGDDDELPF